MAKSQLNITADIIVNTAKAQADLKYFGAQAKEFTRQMNAAMKAGDTAQVDALRKSLDGAYRSMGLANRELKSFGATAQTTSRHTAEAAFSMRELTKYTLEFARGAGFSVFSVRELRLGLAGIVTAKTIQSFKDVADNLIKLGQLSQKAGFSPQFIDQMRKIQEEAGGTADAADAATTKIGDILREAQKAALEAGGAIGPETATVLRGGVKDATNTITNFGISAVTTFHGVQKEAIKFNQALTEIFHIDPKTYGRTLAEAERFTKDLAKSFIEVRKLQPARAEFGLRGLGLEPSEVVPQFEKLAAGPLKDAGPTPAQQKAADDFGIAIQGLGRDFETLRRIIVESFGPGATKTIEDLRAILQDPAFAAGMIEQLRGLGEGISDSIAEFNRLIAAGQAVIDFFDRVDASIRAFGESVRGWFRGGDGGGEKTVPIPQINIAPPDTKAGRQRGDIGDGGTIMQGATGGFIRGAGSGTSDSILARLSNGEFVVNAGSVRRFGIDNLRAINSFAMGGLVGPVPFAAGGLVSAASSSGRPVHLHIGGSSFALSGSSGVVDALVSHAHGQQMRSAGVKPSWFAGRPSGR